MHMVNSVIERELHACKASQSSRIGQLQSLKQLIGFYTAHQASLHPKLAFKLEYLISRSLDKLHIAHRPIGPSDHLFSTFSQLVQDLHDKCLIDLDSLAPFSLKIASQASLGSLDAHAELFLSIHETWSADAEHLIGELAAESGAKASFRQLSELLQLDASRELLKVRIGAELSVVHEHLANDDRLSQSYLIFLLYKSEASARGLSLETPVKYSILKLNRDACSLSASYEIKFSPVALNSRSHEELFARLGQNRDTGLGRQLSTRRFKTLIFTRKAASVDKAAPDANTKDSHPHPVSLSVHIFNNHSLISNFERLYFKQNANFMTYLAHLSHVMDKCDKAAASGESVRLLCSLNDAELQASKRNYALKISLVNKVTKCELKDCMIPLVNIEYFVKNSIDIGLGGEKAPNELSLKLSCYEIGTNELVKELAIDIGNQNEYIAGDKLGLSSVTGIAVHLPLGLKCVRTIAQLEKSANTKPEIEQLAAHLAQLVHYKASADLNISKTIVKPCLEAIVALNSDTEIACSREDKLSLTHALFNALIRILANNAGADCQIEPIEMGANNLRAIKTLLKLARDYLETGHQLAELVKALNAIFEIVIAIYRQLNTVNLELKYEIKQIMRASLRALALDSTLGRAAQSGLREPAAALRLLQLARRPHADFGESQRPRRQPDLAQLAQFPHQFQLQAIRLQQPAAVPAAQLPAQCEFRCARGQPKPAQLRIRAESGRAAQYFQVQQPISERECGEDDAGAAHRRAVCEFGRQLVQLLRIGLSARRLPHLHSEDEQREPAEADRRAEALSDSRAVPHQVPDELQVQISRLVPLQLGRELVAHAGELLQRQLSHSMRENSADRKLRVHAECDRFAELLFEAAV
jgi:hypothetical protein